MKILLTNDDGVYAPGIWAIANALSENHEIAIVAPNKNCSGAGCSISLFSPVTINCLNDLPNFNIEFPCYATSGTPADSAILGLEAIVGKVDLVISGINNGSNFGDDVVFSGTIGAALQGYVRKIPSIALSIASLTPDNFDIGAKVATLIAQAFESKIYENLSLLNINTPNKKLSEVKGITLTTLADRVYADSVKVEDFRTQRFHWVTRTRPDWEEAENTDVWAVRNDLIAITPMTSNLSMEKNPENLSSLLDYLSLHLGVPKK
jgi:5'-nucleotidase